MKKQAPTESTYSIHPGTMIGLVTLTVADLARSVQFYEDVLGFRVIEQTQEAASLGVQTGPALLNLNVRPGATPKPARATGLYHFAILVPDRVALRYSLQRLADTRYPLAGASDHLVSEALYLSDPDGNGIEIYRDRPRESWLRAGDQVVMASDPLDLQSILAEARHDAGTWSGLPADTRIGHIHLQVADLAEAQRFYHRVVGFDIMAAMPGALFLSAGGYHHHLGLNTWQSRGASPAPAGSAGLRSFALTVPDHDERERLVARLEAAAVPIEWLQGTVVFSDPWHNRVVLSV
jgi:catechol 2,3-dioxygenase